MSQPNLRTVSIFRRNYGRRYTDLPVDEISREFFLIDCNGYAMRPELYDLQSGDLARWRQGERFVEATIDHIVIDNQQLHVVLRDPVLLPEDYFPY
ncbi:MAG: hypothetical protein HC822_03070 [Oscillochloris sp.]|nr:hypothetical protein [Oscillochloris sp.]